MKDLRSSSWMLTRFEFGAAILLTAVLVSVHIVFFFHAGPLWRDEISSLNLATKPTLAEFWRSLTFDPFPAGYFVFLRLWNAIGFGDSDLALRAFGFFIGVFLICALWVACNLIDKSPPLWPLALFAFNPLVLEVGGSLRPYGFSFIWVVLAFALLWRVTFGSINKSIAFFRAGRGGPSRTIGFHKRINDFCGRSWRSRCAGAKRSLAEIKCRGRDWRARRAVVDGVRANH